MIGGFDGNDRLYGGAGDTLFFEGVTAWAQASTPVFTLGQSYDFGRGNDTIVGRGGYDTLSYANTRTAMRVDLGLGTIRRGAETDVFRNIEKIIFGRGDDLAIGTGGGVNLDLAQGDDTLRGVTAHSDEVTLAGGLGLDTLDLRDAAPGEVRLRGGVLTIATDRVGRVNGFEVIYGNATLANDIDGAQVIYGGAGFDILRGSGSGARVFGLGGWDQVFGTGRLYGGDGHDTITGGGTLSGGAGRDQILGGIGGDTISGGTGGDLIQADPIGHTGASFDVISGGAGNDSIHGGSGNDSIYGGIGDDQLFADAGIDLVEGGDGNDTILGGEGGGDTLRGGAGNDTITYDIVTTPDTLGYHAARIEGEEGDDVISIAFGTAYGGLDDDVLTASGHKVRLYGGDGDDRLEVTGGLGQSAYGGSGDDSLVITAGGAVIQGGVGVDSAEVFGGKVRTFTVLPGTEAGVTYLSGIEQLTGSNDAVDVQIGRGPMRVTLGSGNDTVQSAQSDSVIVTGGGNDRVTYTGLRGRIDLGEGDNSLNATTGQMLVTSGAGVDVMELTGNRLTIRSGAGDDLIRVTGNGITLETGTGNDSLILNGTDYDIDLGTGLEAVEFQGAVVDAYVTDCLGDVFVFSDPAVTGAVELRNISPTTRIDIAGIDGPADFDRSKPLFYPDAISGVIYYIDRPDGGVFSLRLTWDNLDPPNLTDVFL